MQKRGNIWISKNSTIIISKLLLSLFELFLVVSIYLILVSQVNGIKNDVTFEELYISRDLALLIDAIYAAPGMVSYEYLNDKYDLTRFIFNFKDQNVEVNWEGVRAHYPYSEDKSIPINEIEIAYPEKIIFEKNNERLNIGS